MNEYRIILISLLIIFMIVATFMTIVSLGNALRLRNVKLTWKAGKLNGYPLFSTIFLGTIILGIAAHLFFEISIDLPVYTSYAWIGLNWLMTSFLSSKRYITDHGIVKNINDPSQTISWTQIKDYTETNEDNQTNYLFIYTKRNTEGNTPLVRRIELSVPLKQSASFKKLLERKLGRRFSAETYSLSGFESIN